MGQITTIKLKLKEPVDLGLFQRKYANVVRYAFNRGMEGMSKYDIFKLLNNLKNLDELDLTWRREAAKLGYSIALSAKKLDKTVIFGGRKNFFDRLKGKISREEFLSNKKLLPIKCEGSKADHNGNRKFKFDINTLSGSVKLDGRKVEFSCHKTNRKNMEMLAVLQEKAMNKEAGITYQMSNEYFYISFDLENLPEEVRYKKDKDSTLAIDINPNYIGLSIVRNDEVILRRCYDLSKIKGRNKTKFELTQITIAIKHLCIDYKVSAVGIEKLTMASSNKGKGRRFNKMVNNDWCRDYFFNSLRKHLALIRCQVIEILPQYSSFIGCIMYPDETDSIAASIELNRRLRKFKEIYIDKTGIKDDSVVYPEYKEEYLNRWKKEGISISEGKGWQSVYQWFKESKHSYRLLYNDFLKREECAVSRLNSVKSKVTYVNLCNKIALIN